MYRYVPTAIAALVVAVLLGTLFAPIAGAQGPAWCPYPGAYYGDSWLSNYYSSYSYGYGSGANATTSPTMASRTTTSRTTTSRTPSTTRRPTSTTATCRRSVAVKPAKVKTIYVQQPTPEPVYVYVQQPYQVQQPQVIYVQPTPCPAPQTIYVQPAPVPCPVSRPRSRCRRVAPSRTTSRGAASEPTTTGRGRSSSSTAGSRRPRTNATSGGRSSTLPERACPRSQRPGAGTAKRTDLPPRRHGGRRHPVFFARERCPTSGPLPREKFVRALVAGLRAFFPFPSYVFDGHGFGGLRCTPRGLVPAGR